MSENTKYFFAAAGVLLFGISIAMYHYYVDIAAYFMPQESTQVHVHADFSMYALGERIDLTGSQYQSSTESIKHPSIHFHDGVDTLIHRHAEGITISEFLSSIGITLTNKCLTLDTGPTYCSDSENALVLYVNGQSVADIASYITQEEDRVLLYYGNPESPLIPAYQDMVTDEACIYSGTCPERGEPPFETCGITCEI